MTTAIRAAGAADAAAMRRLAVLAFDRCTGRIGREPRPMTADHEAIVARGHGWVAEHLGRPVGMPVLEPAACTSTPSRSPRRSTAAASAPSCCASPRSTPASWACRSCGCAPTHG